MLLKQHFVALTQKFPDFTHNACDGKAVIKGLLPFRATYKNETIEDEYKIEIAIPDDYPESHPIARETEGRISDDFHRNKYADNSLCLGLPSAVIKKFKENQTLLHFVEQQVVPFLFAHSYFKKHGEMPYGELSHGGKGILEYYKPYFGILDDIGIVGFLRILADDNYRGHVQCPCGSQNRLRKCHRKLLLELANNCSRKTFLYEYRQVYLYLIGSGKEIPKEYLSKTIVKELEKNKNAKK